MSVHTDLQAAKNLYGNPMPGAVFKNNTHGIKGKFPYRPNPSKRSLEGSTKQSTSNNVTPNTQVDEEGFQTVNKNKRAGTLVVTEKGEEYFKDEIFDENTYTDACFREFRTLNQSVIDEYLKEQSKLADKKHTGYILIPAFQSGSRDEVIQNVYQSFTFAKVHDNLRNFTRHIRVGSDHDLVIQPTPSESCFLIHLNDPEHLKQLVGNQTIAYFKKDKFSRGENDMKKAGEIRIFAFKKPNFTYIVQNAPIFNPLATEAEQKLLDIFEQQMGDDFIITITAGKKQYQIRPQNGPYQESIETLSGNYKVNIEMKDGAEMRDIKYPYEGKIFLNLSNGQHTVYTEKIGGGRRCRLCRGLNCERDRCVECCRSCFMPLSGEEEHSEVECLENIASPVVQSKTRRLAQKTNDLLHYKTTKTVDIESKLVESFTRPVMDQLKKTREMELKDVKGTYSSVVKKTRKEGEMMATLNRSDNPHSDKMLKMKLSQDKGRRSRNQKNAERNLDRDRENEEIMKSKEYQEEQKRLREEMDQQEQAVRARRAAEINSAMRAAAENSKNQQQMLKKSKTNDDMEFEEDNAGDNSHQENGGNARREENEAQKSWADQGEGDADAWKDTGAPNASNPTLVGQPPDNIIQEATPQGAISGAPPFQGENPQLKTPLRDFQCPTFQHGAGT